MRYDRRFEAADKDKNGKLDLDEYADFLHPGNSIGTSIINSELAIFSHSLSAEVSRMKATYVDERMEEMDKKKDGKVSPEEYISKSRAVLQLAKS